jgi:hypothetical protein
MPDQWLSVAEAAASMKVHPRTIERRITGGKIDSRRNDDGQLQVLINLPDTPPPVESVSNETLETVKELANQQVDIAAGSASALIRVSQEQTYRAENELTLARQDARRYRRESQFAMMLVAAVLLVVIGAVAWTTRVMTTSQDSARRSSDSAALAAQRAQSAETALTIQQQQLNDAVLARAKAEGELNAYKGELKDVVKLTQKPPSTQPTTFIGRMSQAFIGE